MSTAITWILVSFLLILVVTVSVVFRTKRQTPVHKMRDPVAGQAQVVSSSVPSDNAAHARFSMSAVIRGDGVPPTSVRFTGMAPTAKWPHPGSILPITIDRAEPTVFRIEWDEMPHWSEVGTAEANRLADALRAGGGTPGTSWPATSFIDGGSTLVINGEPVDAGRFPGLHEEILRVVGTGQADPQGTKAAIRDLLQTHGLTMPGAPAPTSASSSTGRTPAANATGPTPTANTAPATFTTGPTPTATNPGAAFSTFSAGTCSGVPSSGVPSSSGSSSSAATPGAAEPGSGSTDPAARLRKLDELRRQGLINDTEYDSLRHRVLGDL